MQTDLFISPIVRIGRFAISPDSAQFSQQGFVQRAIAVFPKNPIWIQYDARSPFVADTSLINFYNQGQTYSRMAIDPSGDYCHNFHIEDDLLAEILGHDKATNHFFNFENLSCDQSTFKLQLALLHDLSKNENPDPLQIEEQCLELFQSALRSQIKNSSLQISSKQKPRHRRLMESVKSSLQANLKQHFSLHQLAREHHISPFHLSRLFKLSYGVGISKYRSQQRLRSVSFKLLQGANLTSLAMEYGFSSHSHLSASFKKYFGCSPSEFRQNSI